MVAHCQGLLISLCLWKSFFFLVASGQNLDMHIPASAPTLGNPHASHRIPVPEWGHIPVPEWGHQLWGA